ncbi:putative F-box and associated interaction domains-containing protein [Heracleum sosnowskyi]|uniref:F-box and associated interaction domains-containing protein n=1 Tax=Heracleum sosnowskyi TaxID=360622 RepID=A0AAD8I478_9APIA|nr:putative F-box and associated interaction domains-containing protein [Heracleum sosnowskyi]
MSDVLPELINIIFTRLPVQSLLRFRCVSKSFRALIDSPNFIKSHLNQSLVSNSYQTIVTLNNNNNNEIHSTNFDSLDQPILLTQPATLVLGSCNGLLCLLYNNDVFLYNPSTREKKKLPHVETRAHPSHVGFRGECDKVVYGMGYDCVNDNYKVVRIMDCDHELDSEFMVYSLISNSWRRIKDFPYFIEFGTLGKQNVNVNGALHWPVTMKSQIEDFLRLNEDFLRPFNFDSKIVSFNLATEEFGLIALPTSRDENFPIKVVELGGRLSVHCNERMNYIDIWVMGCYGVKESWSKLYILTVSQPASIGRFVGVQAIVYSLDGQRVLLEKKDGKIYWYDLELKRVKRIRIPGLSNISFTHICVGSLVKLIGAAKTDVSQDKTRKKSQKNIQRSLKSNSWKRIMNFPYFICCNADNVFINGALHWVVTLKRQTEGFVVSFDLATEEYRFVPQPEISARSLLMDVGELGGRLCLHCMSKGNYMDLWVMD